MTVYNGHSSNALGLYTELLRRDEGGYTHPSIILTRNLEAALALQLGQPENALQLCDDVISALERALEVMTDADVRAKGPWKSIMSSPSEVLVILPGPYDNQDMVVPNASRMSRFHWRSDLGQMSDES